MLFMWSFELGGATGLGRPFVPTERAPKLCEKIVVDLGGRLFF